MQLTIESKLTLNNGVEIPRFGLGLYLIPEGKAARDAVLWAIEAGYRHFDTASMYGNERSVGEAIRESGLGREEVFVTTKLWNSDHGYDAALKAFEESHQKLGLDYIDLYLVHWPVKNLRLDTWRAMEEILHSGRCRAIGVSNYMVRHLEELFEQSIVPPTINQFELSPYNYRSRQDLIDFCRKHHIAVEAYSPLTKGEKLNDPKLAALAEKCGKTPAQILIRWSLQRDFIVIPKSANRERIFQNADVFDFSLSDEDMRTLDDFDEKLVTSWDPTNAP